MVVTNSGFRDLNIGLAQSVHGDFKMCGFHSNWQRWWAESRPFSCYTKRVHFHLCRFGQSWKWIFRYFEPRLYWTVNNGPLSFKITKFCCATDIPTYVFVSMMHAYMYMCVSVKDNYVLPYVIVILLDHCRLLLKWFRRPSPMSRRSAIWRLNSNSLTHCAQLQLER